MDDHGSGKDVSRDTTELIRLIREVLRSPRPPHWGVEADRARKLVEIEEIISEWETRDMTTDALWNHESPIRDIEIAPDVPLGIEVPAWIDPDIAGATVAAIVQGGCASGAYMPAVTYHEALATMNEHGEAVTAYIGDFGGSVTVDFANQSWAGFACELLSFAVELWASSVVDEVEDALREDDA